MILWPTHKTRAAERRKKHHREARRRLKTRRLLKDGKRVMEHVVS